jgi:aerobic-type carbon monoxide dehydrogenase small subunit (CoxS/CutS family)
MKAIFFLIPPSHDRRQAERATVRCCSRLGPSHSLFIIGAISYGISSIHSAWRRGEGMAIIKELHVNGSRRRIHAEEERSLLSVLRDDLDLTGSKYGCGEGRCGACTVLIDGQPVRSCTTRVGAVRGKQIRTIEGLASDGKLHPVQEAFLHADAMQCGYCTSGMIMSAVGLLSREAQPSREDIVRSMNGNICRCGVYARIVSAVEQAARAQKEAAK